MSAAPGPRTRGTAGFVLIGVVIFVLALTIIGLSLFSLSSYEAQFLQRSLDEEQAFQSAVGGMERAKFLLERMDDLGLVSQAWPPGTHVVAASAAQRVPAGLVTAGPVSWDPADSVYLSITAEIITPQADTVRRTVSGRFIPRTNRSYYSQIATSSDEIAADAVAAAVPPPTDRTDTIQMLGSVWQGGAHPDTSWINVLGQRPDIPIITGAVPTPDLTAFFADHPVSAATPAAPQAGYDYYLNAPVNSPEYFCAPSSPDQFFYPTPSALDVNVWVHGLAVWEFPRGVRFDGPLVVTGPGSGNCLVIVAGPNLCPPPGCSWEHEPETAVRLFAGLRVDPGVSLIIVSSGRVYLQHINNMSGTSSVAGDLAIYTRYLYLTGPERHPPVGTAKTMLLQHAPTGNLETVYLDLLGSQGALPGYGSGSGRTLALDSGSWQASSR